MSQKTTIAELLANTSAAGKETLLKNILSAGFESGEIDFDTEISGADFVEAFCQQVALGLAPAAANLEKIQKAQSLLTESAEDALDGAVYDILQSQGSDINNGGMQNQIKFLIVEGGLSPEAIKDLADEDGPLREIPE